MIHITEKGMVCSACDDKRTNHYTGICNVCRKAANMPRRVANKPKQALGTDLYGQKVRIYEF